MASASDQNHHNTGGYIAFIGSMVFTILFFIYISFIHKGVDLKEVSQPEGKQEAPAGATDSGAAPAGGADASGVMPATQQPWNESTAMVERGHELYKTACATCHGGDGRGTGPAARNIQPRDLVAGNWKLGGDSLALFNTITKGIEGTGMASFAYMPTTDRWALVHYVRSITKNRIADNQDYLVAEAAKLN